MHSDSAPTVYVNGNPARTDATLRKLERDVAAAKAIDPYQSGSATPVALYLADKVGEKTLHMVTADQQRTPSFTLFGNPDYFLTAGKAGPARRRSPTARTRRTQHSSASTTTSRGATATRRGHRAPWLAWPDRASSTSG